MPTLAISEWSAAILSCTSYAIRSAITATAEIHVLRRLNQKFCPGAQGVAKPGLAAPENAGHPAC